MSNSEKKTDTLMLIEFNKIFGFDYFTSKQSNDFYYSKLFNSKIPDGFIKINNYLIIIENKKLIKQKSEGLIQLLNYYENIPLEEKNKLENIYLILGLGNTEKTFRYNIYEVINKNINLSVLQNLTELSNKILSKSEKENILMKIENQNNNISLQTIHDYIVRELKLDNNNEQCYLICAILLALKLPSFVEDIKNKEFMETEKIKKLIKESYESYNDNYFNEVFKFIDNVNYNNSIYELVKMIYKLILNNKFDILGDLYSQFCKYSKCEDELNIVLTPEWVINLMYSLLIKELKEDNLLKVPLKIYDPCCGSAGLLIPFINNIDAELFKFSLYGTEINKKMYVLTKCNSIVNNLNIKIDHNDCMKTDYENKFDLSIMNPPYTKKVSGYHCWEFVINQMKHIKLNGIGCCIVPSGLFLDRKENENYKKEFLLYSIPLTIVELGKGVFKNVGVSTSILIYKKIENLKLTENIQLKYFDFVNSNAKYYKYIPHVGLKFTKEGLEEIENIKLNKNLIVVSNINFKSSWLSNNKLNNEDMYDKILIDSIEKEIRYKYEIIIQKELKERIEKLKIINELSENHYKSSEIFSLVSKTKNLNYKSSDCSNEFSIPFVAASKNNNGIVGKVKDFEFEASEENPLYTLIKNGDGAAGYIFKHTYNFSCSSSILVLQSDYSFYNNSLNIISTILHSKYNFSNSLNIERFNNEEFILPMKLNKKIKFTNIFEEIQTKEYTIYKCEEGNIPLYSSINNDNPIKLVNEISFDNLGENYKDNLYRINKDGSAGFIFKCKEEKFAITNHVKLFKSKIELNEIIINKIENQLKNIFSFSNSLNSSNINNLYILI